jgi:subtilisin family serine protease
VKLAAIFAALGAAALLATAASARRDATPAAWPGKTVIVGYSTDAALQKALRTRPATIVRQLASLRAVEVRPKGDPAAFAAAVSAARGIEYVQAPATRRSLVEPALAPAAVPGGAYQWQFAVTHADLVPERVARGAFSATIAVVDSGADLTAPDLAGKHPSTYNAMDNSRDVTDTVGHGTFVASIAAGSNDNGEGIAGMGGAARLLTIKAGAEGFFTDFDTAAAITYAVDRGAKIVNLSLGGPRSTPTERRALAYAALKDVLVVAAAGNEHDRGNPTSYPAATVQPLGSNGLSGTGLAVGATTIDGARASFSNTGSYISLAAPGENVFGAISKDSSAKMWPRVKLPGSSSGLYGYSSGTSFAAPQVAGAAALVWGANRSLTSRQVADILKATATGQGQWNPELGYGVINVAAAVELAKTTSAVSLSAFRGLDKAYLRWRGTSRSMTYRLLNRVGDGPDRVVLDNTRDSSYRFEVADNKTHTFTVEAIDGGAVVARSAPAVVTLGKAKSSLVLKPYRFKYRGKRYSVVIALLEPKAPDVRASSRMIQMETLGRHGWRLVSYQFTDAAGRAAWWVGGPGIYSFRARFDGSRDLEPALTKPLRVRGA